MLARIITLIFILHFVIGCGIIPSTSSFNTPVASVQTISIHDAWVRNSPIGDNSAAYMTITNSGEEDTLVTVTGDFATIFELHTASKNNGMTDMHPAEGGVPIPAQRTQMLKPGGYHVMIMGLSKNLIKGQTVQLTLTFAHAGAVIVPVEIR